jgi:hypothetical protein
MLERQLSFEFLHAIDDPKHCAIEGLPARGWIGRCYHPTAEAALKDAYRASALLGRLWVVEHPVTKGFERYWPHSTIWQVAAQEPFGGVVVGAFYYPVPNHYVVDGDRAYFEPGDDPEESALLQQEAWAKFHEKYAGGSSKI